VSGAFTRRVPASLLALAFLSACADSGIPAKSSPSNDVESAPKLARDAGAVLLQVSAYDYGLVGALAGEKTRTVAAARYGAVMRGTAKTIAAFNANVLAGTLDRTGPIREKLVPLADGLSDLARDGETYADGGDPAAFARVISDVTAGWQRLRDLSTVLPKDDALQGTIARGMSFVVTSKSSTQSTITTGPYASAAEAKQALQRMGSPLNGSYTQTAPFVVRIGPYADRAAADTASAGLTKQGVINIVTDAASYSFGRSGPFPEAELWREPSRVQEVRATSRRIAVSSDGAWLLTGSDDGYAALFDPKGTLTALPQGFAGMSVLQFSDGGDAQTFAVGGQVVTFLAVPSGENIGSGMRFTGAATQLLFVRSTRVFVAASGGSTGLPGGGAGLIGGRTADGESIGGPFPIVTPASGAEIAASDAGDVYVGTTTGGNFDIEVFRPGRDTELKAVARIAGAGTAFAVDRSAKFAAAVTDQGTYRFALADPKTLTRVAGAVRDVAFASDGTLYVLDQTSLLAIGPDGTVKWTAPLVDGRRLVVGRRAVVLDGTDKVLAFNPADGTADELGAGGTINDLTMSRDGRVVGVIVDARRAVLFTLP
jgi:outer membrane protein assembly factor BamB